MLTFLQGRPTIIMVIPFLFVSPVVAIFVPNHDIYIYLSVIYTFVTLLAIGKAFLDSFALYKGRQDENFSGTIISVYPSISS